jgi:hypothetical protein
MSKPCYFQGPEIGRVNCRCSGSKGQVFECWSDQVPSHKCTPKPAGQEAEGPITDRQNKRTTELYLVFPYNSRMHKRGNFTLTDSLILCCDCCPFRKEQPDAVVAIESQIQALQASLTEYREAATLEAREAATAKLG